jgi:predicted HAD superfamily Cof-like phosphohydrolase
MKTSHKLLSEVALNNLITMGIASEVDARQIIPTAPCIPNQKVRVLRAKLILEEAFETVHALGFNVMACGHFLYTTEFEYKTNDDGPDLEQIIDGCIDTNYVCTGTLVACGVPDLPHIAEVNRANLDKMKNITVNQEGKFNKPSGWIPPDHSGAGASYDEQSCNLREISIKLVAELRSQKDD